MSLTPDEIARFETLQRFAEKKVSGSLSADGTALYYDIIAGMEVAWRLVDEADALRVERDALAAELQKNAMLYLARDSECMVLYDEKVEAERERDALRTALAALVDADTRFFVDEEEGDYPELNAARDLLAAKSGRVEDSA